jgi:hypothetical protein
METIHPNYGISNTRDESNDSSIREDLPRAVLRSNTHMLLDGEWRFAVDQEDRGLSEGWYLGHEYEGTANWPGSIEHHMANLKEPA